MFRWYMEVLEDAKQLTKSIGAQAIVEEEQARMQSSEYPDQEAVKVKEEFAAKYLEDKRLTDGEWVRMQGYAVDPRITREDLATLARLMRLLWKKHRKLPVYKELRRAVAKRHFVEQAMLVAESIVFEDTKLKQTVQRVIVKWKTPPCQLKSTTKRMYWTMDADAQAISQAIGLLKGVSWEIDLQPLYACHTASLLMKQCCEASIEQCQILRDTGRRWEPRETSQKLKRRKTYIRHRVRKSYSL